MKYTDETVIGGLTQGRICEVKYIEDTLYCIHDDDSEDSLWHPDYLEIVEGSPDDVDEYEIEPIKEEEMNE